MYWKKIKLGGILVCLCCGCTTSVQQQGCYLQAFDISAIKIGHDTQETILMRYGQPSTSSVFPGKDRLKRWYYTHRVVSESPVRGKKSLVHQSIVITFNERGVVQDKKVIVGENNIPVSSKKTKEPGYKTTFLKETFRNIGRFGQSGSISQK